MRLKILGCGGNALADMYTTSALLDDKIALDAGTGLHRLQPYQILDVKDVIITHSHLDHIAMLSFWVDLHTINGSNVTVHCLPETADALRSGIFNNNLWPNMENININNKPALRFNTVTPFETFTVADSVDITPIPVMHGIPTIGCVLHGEEENFVFCSDMIDAPDDTWKYLSRLDKFKRMSMEISFSDGMETIAEQSHHLTPAMLGELIKKLPPHVQVLYNHCKLAHVEKIRQQVYDTLHPRVIALQQGDTIVF